MSRVITVGKTGLMVKYPCHKLPIPFEDKALKGPYKALKGPYYKALKGPYKALKGLIKPLRAF